MAFYAEFIRGRCGVASGRDPCAASERQNSRRSLKIMSRSMGWRGRMGIEEMLGERQQNNIGEPRDPFINMQILGLALGRDHWRIWRRNIGASMCCRRFDLQD